MKINLMSGQLSLPGYKTVDCAAAADFFCKVPPLPPELRGGVIEECAWIHGPNVMVPWDAERLMAELHYEMAKGARLIIECPDIDRCIKSRKLQWIFGDPTLLREAHMVRWGWTPDSLTGYLDYLGWRNIEVKPAVYHIPERDFRVECIK